MQLPKLASDIVPGPDLRGGGGGPGPQAPHQQRAPTKGFIFFSGSIDTYCSCVYTGTTYTLLTSRVIFSMGYFNAGCITTVKYFTATLTNFDQSVLAYKRWCRDIL